MGLADEAIQSGSFTPTSTASPATTHTEESKEIDEHSNILEIEWDKLKS